MVEVHLYGSLRQLAQQKSATAPSVVMVNLAADESIEKVLVVVGIRPEDVGNVFLNGRLARFNDRVLDGDRLGIFPTNMGLLYV